MALLRNEKLPLGLREIAEVQLLLEMYKHGQVPSQTLLKMLAVLAGMGKCRVSDAANLCFDEKLFEGSQSARNAIMKAGREDYVVISKEGRRTMVHLNPKYGDKIIAKDDDLRIEYIFWRRKP